MYIPFKIPRQGLIADLFRYLRTAIRLRDTFWPRRLVESGKRKQHWNPTERLLDVVGLPRVRGVNAFMLMSPDRALRLAKHCGARFFLAESGKLRVRIEGIQLQVETWEELHILVEIFDRNVYGFDVGRDAVYWDIGANVGFSSLYFAARPGARVVSYEIIPDNCTRAAFNISLNPHLQDRIELHASGICSSTRRTDVHYSDSMRGSSGLFSLPEDTGRDGNWTRVQASVLAADDALREIRQRHPDLPIVAKIDCEGCEYEVLQRLSDTGLLSELSAVLLEWHSHEALHDPARLYRLLEHDGFILTHLEDEDPRIGIVHASRPQYTRS